MCGKLLLQRHFSCTMTASSLERARQGLRVSLTCLCGWELYGSSNWPLDWVLDSLLDILLEEDVRLKNVVVGEVWFGSFV